MKYRKIALISEDAGERLSRILYVKNDISLKELGCLFLTSLHSDMEHLFLFETEKKNYISAAYYTDPREDTPVMDAYTIADMPQEFTFLYDTADGWYFTCRMSEETYSLQGKKAAGVLISGKGAGIFEDERESFISYINGEIDPDAEDDYDNDLYLPVNLDLDTFGEFDQPLDIEYEQAFLRKYARKQYRTFCTDEKEIFEDMGEYCQYPEWNAFAKAVRNANVRYEAEDSKEYWSKAAQEFKKICGSLHEKNALPAELDELCTYSGDEYLVRSLVRDMPEDMMDAEEYALCADFCGYVNDMFELNETDMSVIGIHYTEACIRMKQFDKADAFMNEWMNRPENDNTRDAMQLKLLIAEERYEEADRLWEKLREEYPVCDGQASVIYITAADLADAEGDHEYAQSLREMAVSAYEDMFGMDDWDDDSDYDEEDSEEHYGLFDAINEFQDNMSEETMFEAVREFAFLVLSDSPVYIDGECNEDGSVNITISETNDGLRFFTVYSCDEAREDTGYRPVFSGRAGGLAEQLSAAQVDGISIDPYENQIRMFVERSILEDLLNVFGSGSLPKLS